VTVGRELWRKTIRFDLPQGWVDQEERYFLVRLADVSPDVHNSSSEAILLALGVAHRPAGSIERLNSGT
jgi:hypothetical protein